MTEREAETRVKSDEVVRARRRWTPKHNRIVAAVVVVVTVLLGFLIMGGDDDQKASDDRKAAIDVKASARESGILDIVARHKQLRAAEFEVEADQYFYGEPFLHTTGKGNWRVSNGIERLTFAFTVDSKMTSAEHQGFEAAQIADGTVFHGSFVLEVHGPNYSLRVLECTLSDGRDVMKDESLFWMVNYIVWPGEYLLNSPHRVLDGADGAGFDIFSVHIGEPLTHFAPISAGPTKGFVEAIVPVTRDDFDFSLSKWTSSPDRLNFTAMWDFTAARETSPQGSSDDMFPKYTYALYPDTKLVRTIEEFSTGSMAFWDGGIPTDWYLMNRVEFKWKNLEWRSAGDAKRNAKHSAPGS